MCEIVGGGGEARCNAGLAEAVLCRFVGGGSVDRTSTAAAARLMVACLRVGIGSNVEDGCVAGNARVLRRKALGDGSPAQKSGCG